MKLKKQFRALTVDGALKLDKETKTIEFPFSSEYPVERYWGREVLSHEPGAADLTRLNNSAPLLWNHDTNQMIGVVERAWIGSDKRAYAKVRFSDNAKAQEIMKDIESGIIKNVSFGYVIREMDIKDAKSENPEYLVTDFEMYEVSFVAIPADPTVGLGRSESGSENEVVINNRSIDLKNKKEEKRGNNNMAEKIEGEGSGPSKVEIDALVSKGIADEQSRRDEITKMGEKFNQKDLARQLIDNKTSANDAMRAIMEKIDMKQKPVNPNEAVVGLTDKETRKFSFLKAMNALANPGDRSIQEDAKFEFEVSAAAAKKAGKTSRGLMVPVDVLRSGLNKRDLLVGTSSAGGDMVATDLQAASFIELLRNKMALQQAGVRVLNGLTGNIAIPRQTSGATAYWVGENSAVTESQQAIDQVTMSPKTVGAYTDYSRKLLIQSSVDVEGFVREDIANILAIAIDLAGLYGLGSSNQPLGVKLTSGIGTSDFAANAPTFAELVGLETAVAVANADVGSLKYIVNATGRGVMKTTQKGTNLDFIWQNGGVNGYPVIVSNQVAANDFWFGDWSSLILGFWSGLDLLVDPYTGGAAGTVRFIAHQDLDYGVRHAASFCRGNNTL